MTRRFERMVALAALAAGAFSWAQQPIAHDKPLSGTMELECNPPVYVKIDLTGFPEKETLDLYYLVDEGRFLKKPPKHKPIIFSANWCAEPNKCWRLPATVVYDHYDLERGASGTYELEFPDGRNQTGSFKVLRRPQAKPFLCM